MSNAIEFIIRKERNFKAWLFALVCLDSSKMFWFWCSVWVCQQVLSVCVEYLFWGEHFQHWLDPFFTGLCAGLYYRYQKEMGETLLKLILKGEENE